MLTWCILVPGDELVGYHESVMPPTLEDLGDTLALQCGFKDRDELIDANPGLVLGFCALH